VPPLPPQPGVLRIDMQFAASDDPLITQRNFFTYTGTPPTDATCVLLASDCAANGVTQYAGLMDSDHELLGATCRDLTSPSSGYGEYADVHAGTRGGAFLPAGVAALVNFGISRSYRGGKPRAYFPFGVGADLQNNSLWSSTFVTEVTDAVSTWVTDFVGVVIAGLTVQAHVNVSYYLGSTAVVTGVAPYERARTKATPRPTAIAPDLITSIACNPKPGSQRRRNAA
jgi:hypothetical protein